MPAVLAPDSILRDIAGVWTTLARQGDTDASMGVLRACSMTLVVVAEPAGDPQALGETIAALMPEHPARAIVIRLQPAAAGLAGRVFAQCWMPFGQRRQICCEQIEIAAAPPAVEDALRLAATVVAPDLPVILWCRTLALLERPDFPALTAFATRVVTDTAAAPDPQAAVRLLAHPVSQGIALGDLSWTRLTRWREMISQLFENRELRLRIPSAVRVRVGYAGSVIPVAARYMGAWLVDSFRGAGASATLEFQSGSERVELSADGLAVEAACRGARLEVVVNGVKSCASLPAATDYSLMREELKIAGRDPIFERTLRSAAAL